MTTLLTPPMTIAHLTVDDLPLCEPFGQAFHAEKAIPGVFNLAHFLTNWERFLTSGLGTILGLWRHDVLVGGIGGVVTPDLTTGAFVVSELFWYVQPDARHGTWPIRLITELKLWGLAHGATRLRMVHLLMPNESPSTVKLSHVYRLMGLRAIEVAYDGEIKE